MRACSEHVLEHIGWHFALHLAKFPLQLCHINTSAQDEFQFLDVDRLAQKIVRARADRFQGILFLSLTGNDDDLGVIVDVKQLRQNGHAFRRIVRLGWQTQIEQHPNRTRLLVGAHRAGPVLSRNDLIFVPERPLHLGPNLGIIIDDKENWFHGGKSEDRISKSETTRENLMLMLLLLILIGTTENPNIEYRNPKQLEKIGNSKISNRE